MAEAVIAMGGRPGAVSDDWPPLPVEGAPMDPTDAGVPLIGGDGGVGVITPGGAATVGSDEPGKG